MKKTVKSKLIAIAIVIFSASAMAKDEVHNEQVHFDRGTNGITVQDSIKGYATVNYKLAANSGQLMRLSL